MSLYINPLHFGCWNMRGLNDPIKQKEVRFFVNKNKLSLLGLVEHKIKESNSSRILKSMLPFWDFAHNYTHSPNGRIIVTWDPSIVHVSVLGSSSQAIHCNVQSLSGDVQFLATVVYGSNFYCERNELWQSLTSWRSPTPWIILGDFNAIRSQSDKMGGDCHWPPHMEDFNKCISHNDLDDLKYSGCHYTWSNKQASSHFVSTKIDRALVNEHWMRTFPCSSAHFLAPGISDHSPIVVSMILDTKKIKKPFKFFNFLADHPDFISIVQSVWRRVIIGNPMYVVCTKLRLLQDELKKLNSRDYSDISTRTLDTKQKLESIQLELGSDPSNSSKQIQEKELYRQYIQLARAEESFASQKSRIQWLRLGDHLPKKKQG